LQDRTQHHRFELPAQMYGFGAIHAASVATECYRIVTATLP
jgi:hypothetical protein